MMYDGTSRQTAWALQTPVLPPERSALQEGAESSHRSDSVRYNGANP